MCYVIITCRSLLWTLLSVASFLMLLAAVTSPQWLVGFSRQRGLSSQPVSANTSEASDDGGGTATPGQSSYQPTLGIYNRCLKLVQYRVVPRREHCATYVTDFGMPDAEFPDAWKACLVFFGLGGGLLLMTAISALLSLCARTVCGKSVFTLAGLLQSIAGLMCVLGLVVYPAGWGTDKVKDYCGQYAGPFNMDRCQLGWSFYLAVGGTVLSFLCAMLSIQADSATSCHKVEEEILEGKNLICVL
ncbi:LHFPL tetraspan subfamily member 2 protein-like [Babylonia areolata]|uniref:LHFPL tetraspan subfamily member 2 protein-like n=1 Tax=Babylonia areolata TaxID=304850 RepID=UPI003FD63375